MTKRRPIDSASILILEDDPEICETYDHYLRAKGFNTYCFTTLEDAWDLLKSIDLKKKKPSIDLAILDGFIFGETSLKFAEALRKMDSRLPIILCSGNSVGLKLLAKQWIFNTVLDKPVNPQDLIDAVRRAVAARMK